ncbi:hypothetical protein DPMN_175084 [Dreissena polymorpha]|uniref:Uncharacterized protein n=1 Tax=Dreissena polymorpha TaxID=45954 RepID=A0A9D4E5T6_DREPO|nr:hypothetical protein DPMN_175084 [Dreissena polymorpha]
MGKEERMRYLRSLNISDIDNAAVCDKHCLVRKRCINKARSSSGIESESSQTMSKAVAAIRSSWFARPMERRSLSSQFANRE